MLRPVRDVCYVRLGVSPAEAAAVAMAYFVQGVLALTDLATNYYFKDLLLASPAQSSLYSTIYWLPWTAKPLYGLLTDTLPIRGRRRKPYLLLSGLTATVCFLLLWLLPASLTLALGLLTSLSLAIACSDVVVDGIVVERSRDQPAAIGGALQSLCWVSRYSGSIITAWCGGWVVERHGPQAAFGISAVFPFLVAASAAVLKEPAVHEPVPGKRLTALMRLQLMELWNVVRRPHIWKPLLFMVTMGCLPSASSAMFYYFTNHLGFSAEFMGHMETFAYIAAIAGIAAYNTWFKTVPVRRLLAVAFVVSTGVGLARLLLVTGVNRSMGIPDKAFAAVDKAVLTCVDELAMMPMLVLAARMCPSGVEATLFAALMSIHNAAYGVGNLVGSLLTWLLRITADDFNLLWLLLTITSTCTLILIPMLHLIPRDLNSVGGGQTADNAGQDVRPLPANGYSQLDRSGRTDSCIDERLHLLELAEQHDKDVDAVRDGSDDEAVTDTEAVPLVK